LQLMNIFQHVQCHWNYFEIISDVITCEIKLFQRFITVRLHVMQRTILLLQFCLSVCLSVRLSVGPSVRCVYGDKTKRWTVDILIPRETAITVVFWHQQWLAGDAPFPLKSVFKVTHPLRKTPTSTQFRL